MLTDMYAYFYGEKKMLRCFLDCGNPHLARQVREYLKYTDLRPSRTRSRVRWGQARDTPAATLRKK